MEKRLEAIAAEPTAEPSRDPHDLRKSSRRFGTIATVITTFGGYSSISSYRQRDVQRSSLHVRRRYSYGDIIRANFHEDGEAVEGLVLAANRLALNGPWRILAYSLVG